MTRAVQNYNFYLSWTSISKVMAIKKCNLTTFCMASYQIWPYHMTQAENLLFSYLKSYCTLNFRESHQILLFCCIQSEMPRCQNLSLFILFQNLKLFWRQNKRLLFYDLSKMLCFYCDTRYIFPISYITVVYSL